MSGQSPERFMEEVSEQSPERFMEEALKLARMAYDAGEVPVGAVIVKDGRIIGRGFNSTETDKDPTAHAEMKAIRQAAKTLGGWRLFGCSMYVTLEPCSMCAGAIVLSRLDHLYIGTLDPKSGACLSLANIPSDDRLNHQVELHFGILQQECSAILKEFFRELRNKNTQAEE